jgi:hypothetical protein
MSVNDRVKAHRRRMKERGLREMRFWVPDVNSPEFAKAAHEQSLILAAADRGDPSVQEWVDEMSVWDDLP